MTVGQRFIRWKTSAQLARRQETRHVASVIQLIESLKLWTVHTSAYTSRIMEVPVLRRKSRKRKLPGHYCWACDRRLSNEKFSGHGHARNLCRDCATLGAEELAYRQALRNLERCMTWEGIVPRKRRKSFERFLHHDDTRIRALAKQMQAEGGATRKLLRVDAEFDEIAPAWSTSQADLDQGFR